MPGEKPIDQFNREIKELNEKYRKMSPKKKKRADPFNFTLKEDLEALAKLKANREKADKEYFASIEDDPEINFSAKESDDAADEYGKTVSDTVKITEEESAEYDTYGGQGKYESDAAYRARAPDAKRLSPKDKEDKIEADRESANKAESGKAKAWGAKMVELENDLRWRTGEHTADETVLQQLEEEKDPRHPSYGQESGADPADIHGSLEDRLVAERAADPGQTMEMRSDMVSPEPFDKDMAQQTSEMRSEMVSPEPFDRSKAETLMGRSDPTWDALRKGYGMPDATPEELIAHGNKLNEAHEQGAPTQGSPYEGTGQANQSAPRQRSRSNSDAILAGDPIISNIAENYPTLDKFNEDMIQGNGLLEPELGPIPSELDIADTTIVDDGSVPLDDYWARGAAQTGDIGEDTMVPDLDDLGAASSQIPQQFDEAMGQPQMSSQRSPDAWVQEIAQQGPRAAVQGGETQEESDRLDAEQDAEEERQRVMALSPEELIRERQDFADNQARAELDNEKTILNKAAKDQAIIAKAKEAASVDYQKDLSDLKDKSEAISSREVDSGRWWSSRSTGQKIGLYMSAMGDGYLGVSTGRGGNATIDMVMSQVAQDIEIQQQSIENGMAGVAQQQSVLGQAYAATGDMNKAKAIAMRSVLLNTESKMRNKLARVAVDGTAAVRYREAIGALGARRLKDERAFEAHSMKKATWAVDLVLDQRKGKREQETHDRKVIAEDAEAKRLKARRARGRKKPKQTLAMWKAGVDYDENGNFVKMPKAEGEGGGAKTTQEYLDDDDLESAAKRATIDTAVDNSGRTKVITKISEATLADLEFNDPGRRGVKLMNNAVGKDGKVTKVPFIGNSIRNSTKAHDKMDIATEYRRLIDNVLIERGKNGGAIGMFKSDSYQKLTSWHARIITNGLIEMKAGAPSVDDMIQAGKLGGDVKATNVMFSPEAGLTALSDAATAAANEGLNTAGYNGDDWIPRGNKGAVIAQKSKKDRIEFLSTARTDTGVELSPIALKEIEEMEAVSVDMMLGEDDPSSDEIMGVVTADGRSDKDSEKMVLRFAKKLSAKLRKDNPAAWGAGADGKFGYPAFVRDLDKLLLADKPDGKAVLEAIRKHRSKPEWFE